VLPHAIFDNRNNNNGFRNRFYHAGRSTVDSGSWCGRYAAHGHQAFDRLTISIAPAY